MDLNFSRGVESLEDLKTIVDSDLCLFVDQILYHMVEMGSKLDQGGTQSLTQLPSLQNLISQSLESNLKNILKSIPTLTSAQYNCETLKINLIQWNKIIDFIGDFLSIAKIFKFKNQLNLSLTTDRMDLIGQVNRDDWEEDAKLKVYQLTRIFLRKNTLLTYKILDQLDSNTYSISFLLDFSHSEENCQYLDFSESLGLSLGLPRVLFSYEISESNFQEMPDHNCLEIDEKLNLVKYNNIPNQSERIVLHFSFLFRPLSLIIPKRGTIISIEKIQTGNELSHEMFYRPKYDHQNYLKGNSFYYLDFFSLFNF